MNPWQFMKWVANTIFALVESIAAATFLIEGLVRRGSLGSQRAIMAGHFRRRMLGKVSRRMARKYGYSQDSAGDEAFALQLQDEEFARQLEQLEHLQVTSTTSNESSSSSSDSSTVSTSSTSSATSNNSQTSLAGSVARSVVRSVAVTAERESTWLRSFGVNLRQVSRKECGICGDSQPLFFFMSTSGCTHEYCLDCCKQNAEARISSGVAQVSCPHEDCESAYSMEQLSSSLLSPASFEILDTRLTEAAIPESLKIYCPFADCSAFMMKQEDEFEDDDESEARSTFAECFSCHRGFCQACNVPWHGDQSCTEHRAHALNSKLSSDQKLRELAKQEKWQTCPECHRLVERTEGCKHMTCVCKNEFCYLCGERYVDKEPTCLC